MFPQEDVFLVASAVVASLAAAAIPALSMCGKKKNGAATGKNAAGAKGAKGVAKSQIEFLPPADPDVTKTQSIAGIPSSPVKTGAKAGNAVKSGKEKSDDGDYENIDIPPGN